MSRQTARESPFVLSGSCSGVRRTPDPQCPWNCLCWALSLLQRHGRWRADAETSIALLAYEGFGSSKRVADAQLQMGHWCHHTPRLRGHLGRKGRKNIRTRGGRVEVWSPEVWAWPDCCVLEHITAIITCTSSPQDWARHQTVMDDGRSHDPTFPLVGIWG